MEAYTKATGAKVSTTEKEPTLPNSMPSTTATGRMASSTELARSCGLMARCIKESGSTADSRAGANLWVKRAQYTKGSGLRGSIMAEVVCRLLQARYTREDGKTASF